MSSPGKSLRQNNEELITYMDQLKQQRSELAFLIKKQEDEKTKLEKDASKIYYKLKIIEKSLKQRVETIEQYDKTIKEIEMKYQGLANTAQQLLVRVKTESNTLESTIDKKIGTDESLTIEIPIDHNPIVISCDPQCCWYQKFRVTEDQDQKTESIDEPRHSPRRTSKEKETVRRICDNVTETSSLTQSIEYKEDSETKLHPQAKKHSEACQTSDTRLPIEIKQSYEIQPHMEVRQTPESKLVTKIETTPVNRQKNIQIQMTPTMVTDIEKNVASGSEISKEQQRSSLKNPSHESKFNPRTEVENFKQTEEEKMSIQQQLETEVISEHLSSVELKKENKTGHLVENFDKEHDQLLSFLQGYKGISKEPSPPDITRKNMNTSKK